MARIRRLWFILAPNPYAPHRMIAHYRARRDMDRMWRLLQLRKEIAP